MAVLAGGGIEMDARLTRPLSRAARSGSAERALRDESALALTVGSADCADGVRCSRSIGVLFGHPGLDTASDEGMERLQEV